MPHFSRLRTAFPPIFPLGTDWNRAAIFAVPVSKADNLAFFSPPRERHPVFSTEAAFLHKADTPEAEIFPQLRLTVPKAGKLHVPPFHPKCAPCILSVHRTHSDGVFSDSRHIGCGGVLLCFRLRSHNFCSLRSEPVFRHSVRNKYFLTTKNFLLHSQELYAPHRPHFAVLFAAPVPAQRVPGAKSSGVRIAAIRHLHSGAPRYSKDYEEYGLWKPRASFLPCGYGYLAGSARWRSGIVHSHGRCRDQRSSVPPSLHPDQLPVPIFLYSAYSVSRLQPIDIRMVRLRRDSRRPKPIAAGPLWCAQRSFGFLRQPARIGYS